MRHTLAKSIVFPTLATIGALCSVSAQAQDILGRVISSTAVIQQVAVPHQVCNSAAVVSEAPNSGAGAVMGALAGGAVGNAIGNGGGRALATMIGLVGGAVVGNNVEGSRGQVQNLQQCSTQTSYENRTMHYDVVYEYADKRYSIQMPNDPGQYVRLQLNPVGTLPPPAQTYQPYQQYQQPNVVYSQPTTVYMQPAPTVVYAQPYYQQPYYPPIGISLGFGYSRGYGGGYGGGHRGGYGHWR